VVHSLEREEPMGVAVHGSPCEGASTAAAAMVCPGYRIPASQNPCHTHPMQQASRGYAHIPKQLGMAQGIAENVGVYTYGTTCGIAHSTTHVSVL
jgi:hypothetical protein